MVRTLVFQSSNVGSIPAGPIMTTTFHKNLLLKNKIISDKSSPELSCPNTVIYNFHFISLVAPFIMNNLRLASISSVKTSTTKTKILLKQSYLILTWFYYLTFSINQSNKFNHSISFACLPTTSQSYTLTKAPMAQKTRSKEQFHFKFYVLKISLKTSLHSEFTLKSLNQTLLALLMIKMNFPIFETNLMFLKYYNIALTYTDTTFFNYQHFLHKNLK